MSAEPAQPEVVIVRTGSANLASVSAAVSRLGGTPVVTDDPARVRGATRAILPGVGAFGAAMSALRASGCDGAVLDYAQSGRPLLCVCLGMQILLDASEETPGVRGLGLARGVVTRFVPAPGSRVPQLGWNTVTPGAGCTGVRPGYAYFANSYRVERAPEGWCVASTDYTGLFISAMQRGGVLACQFHPELSGPWGAGLIGAWLGLGVHGETSVRAC